MSYFENCVKFLCCGPIFFKVRLDDKELWTEFQGNVSRHCRYNSEFTGLVIGG